ncbi:DUF5067 domain-containing protein [Schaalia sp. Marseille-Q2122]|uniref:DUF5067 domain-containing protein n=1 Tax=Schaalia sp. Marseille-Q2122 TaxID=2736604 RepID=UPI00158A51E7|nr:DUF5067 domain-containing protein [Schaalia sp. Marseille-Q2122]
MSFPDGQPRPDETPSDQEFPPVPEQPQPEMPTEAESAAEPVVHQDPFVAPSDQAPEAPLTQPYAAPYASGPFATASEEPAQPATPYASEEPVAPAMPEAPAPTEAPYGVPQDQPYGAPEAVASAQFSEQPQPTPYGAPQAAPYGAPQAGPYATPQAAPYGAPQAAPYGAPQAAYGVAPAGATKPLSALGITALVMAVIAILLSWIPFINLLSYLLAIPALVMGIIAIVKSGPQGATRGRGIAIAATIISVLALILTFALQALYARALTEFGNDLEKLQQQIEQQANEAPTTELAPEGDAPVTAPDGGSGMVAEAEGDIDEGNYHIKLLSMSKSVNDYEGNATAALTYELTNQRKDGEYNMFDVQIKAFQNGIQLKTAVYSQEVPEGFDYKDVFLELKPGATHTFVTGFVLRDPSAPVLIEAEGLFTEGMVTKEFPLN